MAESKNIREVVERAIAEVFDSRMSELRQAVAERVAAELETAAPATASNATGGGAAELDAAVSSVHDSTAQADILRSLVEGAAKFAGRVALLVARGGTLSGWQARGFDDNDAVKSVSLDSSQGLAGRAIQDRTPAGAAAAEFSSDFVKRFGNPVDGNAVVLPLVVREKVPAVLYTDAGIAQARFDASALQLLVRSTGLWLELIALRRSASPSAEAESTQPIPPPVAAAAAAGAAAAVAPAPVAVASPPPPPALAAAPAVEEAPAAVPVSAGSPEDEEVHKKAKRFAKLLVDEIKLYNQAKVMEGRKNKDLYDRLKDDIDKSRVTYEKRYGSTVAASANYFVSEVVRILADNDRSLLGSNFPAS